VTDHELHRPARPRRARREDRRQGALAGEAGRRGAAGPTGDRPLHRALLESARGRPPAPGALAAIESAARALHEAPWPAGFAGALAGALAALDSRAQARFVVRSSAAIEDRPDALGAGLFLSRLDLRAAEVEPALREVLASALAPGVVAYFARQSLSPVGLGFAALIHPFVAGDAAGSAALDSSHGAPVIDAHHGDATRARARIQDALTRLTVKHGPVEIEWAATGYEVTFLQMRPYRRPTRARLAAVTQSGLQFGLHLGWHWDAAHNPLPLSPAQAGLVALVDRVCDTGLRQQTLRGYLFYSHAPRPAGTTRRTATSVTAALAALRALADARLTPAGLDGSVSLDQALDNFVAIYQPLFGVVQPAARAARKALSDFLQRQGLDPRPLLPRLLAAVPSAARERVELARAFARAAEPAARAAARAAYLDRFGDESPCWDVAVPTWRETSVEPAGRLAESPDEDWHAAADSVRAALPPSARPAWSDLLTEARSGVAAAEDDDALYARAQAHVRRALLREGARLAARGLLGRADEIFWLPLDLVRHEARHEARGEARHEARGETTLTRAETARLVDDARRADAEARQTPPSLADAGRASDVPGLVRGRPGAGGVCIGRVKLWNEAGADAARGGELGAEPTVIVARTILPTELPLIAAAALVVETGGPLDHVAAQARERGIPAVVSALGALTAFAEGDRVLVDGDAGLVARID
jgi:phosphohistidine swiveling domain-containing protein